MNFSDVVEVSRNLVTPSSNGIYIASASQHKVFVHITNTLQIFQIFSCVDIVDGLLWSEDCLFVLSILKNRGIVQVFSLENPEWTCKVDEGSSGLLSATWAPDSRHFLTTTDFHLRITVWSVSEVSISYLKFPKGCENNLAFCPGGRYLALLERRNFEDHLSLFDCRLQWTLLWNITLDTNDAENILWSPDGLFIVVWDNCLRYKAVVYRVDGKHLCTYCAYESNQMLGIKSVSWSPTGQLLAIGSYDEKCRILNSFNWTCLACLKHPVDVSIDPSLGLSPTGHPVYISNKNDGECTTHRINCIHIYEEIYTRSSSDFLTNLSSNHMSSSNVQYKLINNPVIIESKQPDPKKAFPKIGISFTEFSSDGRFLATRNDNCSNVIWIWSIDRYFSLFSLLIHNSGEVSSVMWDPNCSARLALCTGSDTVFLWTPHGCLAVQSPAHFNLSISSIGWLSSGDVILLRSDNGFCLCYLDSNDNVVGERNPIRRPSELSASNDKLNLYEENRNSESESVYCPPSSSHFSGERLY
ncbi:unnamed protein product [Heterobilharzia americana]|nr:unnamed protein product [Heterobilharzia americana]CAH8555807.1 unnamed protein product [Heterobilharzia americana]